MAEQKELNERRHDRKVINAYNISCAEAGRGNGHILDQLQRNREFAIRARDRWSATLDALEQAEIKRDRAELLADRWRGILNHTLK
jgi:hypothetical protein